MFLKLLRRLRAVICCRKLGRKFYRIVRSAFIASKVPYEQIGDIRIYAYRPDQFRLFHYIILTFVISYLFAQVINKVMNF